MAHASRFGSIGRFSLVLAVVVMAVTWFVTLRTFQAGSGRSLPVATYSQGVLRVTIPYRLEHAGSGRLMIEVLNPENSVLGHLEQRTTITRQRNQWQGDRLRL